MTPFPALLAAWRALPPDAPLAAPAAAPQHAWAGQVTSRRALHRGLLFLSLAADGSGAAPRAAVEVLVRRDVVGDAAADAAARALRAGDVVRVCGALEGARNTLGRPLLVATRALAVARAWDARARGAFDAAARDARPCLGAPPSEADDAGGAAAGAEAAGAAGAHAAAAPPRAARQAAAARAEELFCGVPLHGLCRHWVAARLAPGAGCRARGACAMAHELPGGAGGDAALRAGICAAWGRWRARAKRLGQARAPDDDGAPALARAGHGARARVFAEWLLAAAPRGALAGTVLDVAGGRGDVAAALGAAGVRVVTVDPRPPRPAAARRRGGDAARAPAAHAAPVAPAHIAELFDAAEGDAFLERHAEILGDITLVLGFHPDEATQHALDFALARKVPYAIVPCCVFAAAAPAPRVRPCGAPVTSVAHFVAWLEARSAAAGRPPARAFLEYAGANLVLAAAAPGGAEFALPARAAAA